MKEHPILFTSAMVKAILAGKKTQTRRIVKPQPGNDLHGHLCWGPPREPMQWWVTDPQKDIAPHCPYGKPGDKLWVRETWGVASIYDSVKPRDLKPNHMKVNFDGQLEGVKKRPSIFMPRWASRIQLEIVSVRVQRLNDISANDAEAEGIVETEFWTPRELESRPFEEKWWDDYHFWENYPQLAYSRLWESINGKGSWELNPWVWVVEFKKVNPNGELCEGRR